MKVEYNKIPLGMREEWFHYKDTGVRGTNVASFAAGWNACLEYLKEQKKKENPNAV